jgi:hypothetical protein
MGDIFPFQIRRRCDWTWLNAIGVACLVLSTAAASGLAFQPAAAPAGHWTGTIAGPELAVEIDLASKGANAWHGTISIPAQGTKGLPLGDIAVKGTAVSFAIPQAPGDARYAGTLSADGKTITGNFTQGGASMALTLAWKGEAKFEAPEKSTPITKDLEGTWEGPLDVNGKILRLVLKLANGSSGATGTLISVDQNGIEIPIATITQNGARVKLAVTVISGGFEGELKGGELAGTWTQGPLSLPLVFKRAK